jgi:serralysin
MAKQARTAAASAVGVALAAGALSMALAPGRNTAELAARAGQVPPAPEVQMGLTPPSSIAAAFCFDAAHPPSPEVMAMINQIMASQQGELDYQLGQGSWSGSQGNPPSATLTWSLVPDGTVVPGLSGQAAAASTLFSSMDAKFGNNRALWISLIQSCFDRWGALHGVNFQRVTNNGNDWDDGASFPNSGGSNTPGATRGSFRVSMRVLDGNGGVLAFNYYPTTSDMVVDSSENWQSSGNNYRFLRNTLTHETGHGLGLAHCCPMNSSKLMEPALATAFDGPQQDDIRGVHRLYGDFYEPNNSAAAATNLGSVTFGTSYTPSAIPAPGVSNATRASIDRLADQDYFKFTVPGSAALNVTLTPRGSSYLDGPQNGDGTCSAGTSTNSLTAAVLALQVLGTNGSTVLATAPAQPAGTAQSLVGVSLPDAGTYYIRVSASSSANVQLYDLTFSAAADNVCPQWIVHPDGQDVCAGASVFLFASASGAPSPTYQWRRNGNPLPGQTGQTLFFTATTTSAGDYDCVATNSCSSITSNVATVTVTASPTISQQPSSITVPAGSPASFSVVASPEGVGYQWYKDGNLITGANASTYEIASVTQAHAGSYACEVFNECDGTTSNPATLTVGGQSCYANCDASTAAPILNVLDFSCFLNKFAAGDPYANCDSSTAPPVLNVLDFSCFLNKFAAGCP